MPRRRAKDKTHRQAQGPLFYISGFGGGRAVHHKRGLAQRILKAFPHLDQEATGDVIEQEVYPAYARSCGEKAYAEKQLALGLRKEVDNSVASVAETETRMFRENISEPLLNAAREAYTPRPDETSSVGLGKELSERSAGQADLG